MSQPKLLDRVRMAIRLRHYSRRREVLKVDLGAIDHLPRAKTPVTVPVVMSPHEVRRVLTAMYGVPRLVASILYGAGLRLRNVSSFASRISTSSVRRSRDHGAAWEGGKDRRVMLPVALRGDLARHVEAVRRVHDADVAAGFGRVVLPGALAAKFSERRT